MSVTICNGLQNYSISPEGKHVRIARNAATILAGVESTKHGPIPIEVAVPYCVSRAIAIEAEVAKQMEEKNHV